MAGPDHGDQGASLLVHASCVRWHGRGILLFGPSGSGKSDLALRLMDAGAELVADDQVFLSREGGRLLATAPARLQGLIEIRGYGIVRVPHTAATALDLALELQPGAAIERLPDPAFGAWLGLELPLLRFDPHPPSSVARVKLVLLQDRVA